MKKMLTIVLSTAMIFLAVGQNLQAQDDVDAALARSRALKAALGGGGAGPGAAVETVNSAKVSVHETRMDRVLGVRWRNTQAPSERRAGRTDGVQKLEIDTHIEIPKGMEDGVVDIRFEADSSRNPGRLYITMNTHAELGIAPREGLDGAVRLDYDSHNQSGVNQSMLGSLSVATLKIKNVKTGRANYSTMFTLTPSGSASLTPYDVDGDPVIVLSEDITPSRKNDKVEAKKDRVITKITIFFQPMSDADAANNRQTQHQLRMRSGAHHLSGSIRDAYLKGAGDEDLSGGSIDAAVAKNTKLLEDLSNGSVEIDPPSAGPNKSGGK